MLRKICLFFILLSIPCLAGSGTFIDSALTLIVKQQYIAARQILNDVLSRDGNNFEALYLLLTTKQSELLDYESYAVDGDAFLCLADSVLRRFENSQLKSRGMDSTRYLLYIGNIYGGKSLILAKRGEWMPAVKFALTSVSMLNKAKAIDSTLYEACLGTGVFNYYLSQNLKWVPFMGDRTKEGIMEIEKSTRARFPFNYAARNSLAWIFIDRGEYAKAETIVDKVLSDYPDNTIFLRIKARIALWTGRVDQAISLSRRLCDLSAKRNPVNWSDLISGYQIIIQCYEKTGKRTESVATARQVLKFEVPQSAKRISYVKHNLQYIENIISQKASVN
jgi:tetratricopeptide (TPR) repeat protein